MMYNKRFFILISLFLPNICFGAVDVSAINNAQTIPDAISAFENITKKLLNEYKDIISDQEVNNAETHKENAIKAAKVFYGKTVTSGTSEDTVSSAVPVQKTGEEELAETATPAQANENAETGSAAAGVTPEQEKLDTDIANQKEKTEKAQQDYKDAKAKEQSTENKMLSGLTMAATGIGAMELAQGLSEQRADKDAEADMSAYISTFRCSYADGKSVKGGPEEIELPGANNSEMMKLRNEYTTLAADLKIRKEALGMKPGIESEEILDKANIGLYDDENVGKTGGKYASLYRAKALNSEEDQARINADKETSKKRVTGGAIALGVGAAAGIVGNELINGKLGDRLKAAKEKKEKDSEAEEEALKTLKACLKSGAAKNTDKLKFKKFTPSILNFDNIDCYGNDWKKQINERNAKDLFVDSDDEQTIINKLTDSFGTGFTDKLLGVHTEITIKTPTNPSEKLTINNNSVNFNFKYFKVPDKDPSPKWIQENCQYHSYSASLSGMRPEHEQTACKKYHEDRCEHYVMGDTLFGGCNSRALSSDQSSTCNYCQSRENTERICFEELQIYCYEKGYLYPEKYKDAQQEMNGDWFEYACLRAKGTPSGGSCLCNGRTLPQVSNTNVIKFTECK